MTNEELAIAIQEGQQEQIDVLWEQVIRFIRLSAMRWKAAHPDSLPDVEDLIQSGYFALLKAVHYYVPDKGYTLISLLALTLKSSFAEAAGMRLRSQRHALKVKITSLDAPLGEDDENDLLVDMLADPEAEKPFESLGLTEEQHMIREELSNAAERLLSAKQRLVLDELLAADLHVSAVASANHMSIKTVSRLKSEAFWRLKADARIQALYASVCGFDDDLTSASLCGTGLSSFKHTGMSVVERVTFQRMSKRFPCSGRDEGKEGYTAEYKPVDVPATGAV